MSVKQYKNGQLIPIAERAGAPDVALNADSTNSVQNKVITEKFSEIDDTITQLTEVLSTIPKIAHGNTAVTSGASYDTFDINFTSAGFSSAPNVTITPVSQFGDVTVSFTGINSSHAYGLVLPKGHASTLQWIAVEG